jgi:hypothetical protein
LIVAEGEGKNKSDLKLQGQNKVGEEEREENRLDRSLASIGQYRPVLASRKGQCCGRWLPR